LPDTRKHLRAIGSEIAGLLHALGLTAYGRNRLGVVIETGSPSRIDEMRAAADAHRARQYGQELP
jgi:hypothetical protein